MKILQVNKFYYLKGGAESYYFDLSDLFSEKGHKIIPFAMQDQRNNSTEYAKYFIDKINIEKVGFSIKDLKAAGRILYSFESRRKIKKLLDVEKIDIAHIHNIYHQISPSILSAIKERNIPIVMTVHDFKLMCPVYSFYTHGEICERCKVKKYYNCVLHKCAKNSYFASKINMVEMYLHRMLKIYRNNIDLYICPSKFVRDKMIEFGWPRKKIIVVPHFVKSQDDDVINEVGEYALFFGRLIKEKGIADLLRAYKYLKNEKIKIAGTGPQEKEYKNFIKKEGMENVEFTGYLPRVDLKKVIAKAKYTIVPSLSYETFGLSITESFAQGKAVIASNVGALPELVKNMKTGIIYQSGNWRDLKNKIIVLNKDKNKIVEMGKNAREYVINNLSSSQHYSKLLAEYNKLLK